MRDLYQMPLAAHFETRTFAQLGINPNRLTIVSSHQPTWLPPSGMARLMSKMPWASDEPVAMDIDVSCGLYNQQGELLDVIWYGNLRNVGESVRHHGDTFIGMNKAYRPNLVEERLTVRLQELSSAVYRLALFVHSKNDQALALAVDGMVFLQDSEDNVIHQHAFASFEQSVKGFCAWQLVRIEDDWRISAPMSAINAKNSGEIAKKWHGIAHHAA